jgi:hypothetical protein
MTLTQDLDSRLRQLYSQFFSNEYKQAQDKIRNKNQVFKQVHGMAQQELMNVREVIRQALMREAQGE